MSQTEKISDILDALDVLIKSGNSKQAGLEIEAISLKDIPRVALHRFANIARRSGKIEISIRSLSQLIRTPQLNIKANDSEILEYCKSLLAMGFLEEAEYRLKDISEKTGSKYHFTQFMLNISRWDYLGGLENLNQLIRTPNLDAYERVVAVTNKIQALIALEFFDMAQKILFTHLQICKMRNWNRLALNACDLLLQVAVETADFDLVERTKIEISELQKISNESTTDNLWLNKWLAIVEYMKSKDISPLTEIREQAIQAQHWETLRSLDYYELRVKYDADLLNKLWYGTPYSAYRSKLELRFPDVASSYSVNIEASDQLDLDTGKFNNENSFKIGSNSHRLLLALFSDFYRPLPNSTLQQLVFPDEYFDVDAPYHKLHQAVDRLKKAIAKDNIPIEIVFDDYSYTLVTDLNGRPCGVRVSKHPVADNFGSLLQRAKSRYGNEEFGAKDLREFLDISKTSARRILALAIKNEVLEKYGAGVNTVYCFKS